MTSPEATGGYTISVKKLAVAIVGAIIVFFIVVSIIATRSIETPTVDAAEATEFGVGNAQPNETLQTYSDSAATVQVFAGFGLLSLWMIAGTVMIASAQGDKTITFGAKQLSS